jgi:hypothetical protein
VRSIGADTLADINRTGRLPANDDKLYQEVRAMRGDIQRLLEVTAKSGDISIEKLESLEQSAQLVAGTLRLQQWKKA